jgi:hypothetical protein
VRIDCHIPVTLRIAGAPTDDQLAEMGRALARAITARLAEAERLFADRYGHAVADPHATRPLAEEPREAKARNGLFSVTSLAVPAAPAGFPVSQNDDALGEAADVPTAEADRLDGLPADVPPIGFSFPGTSPDSPPRKQIPTAERFDTEGSKRNERRAEVARHGGDPDTTGEPLVPENVLQKAVKGLAQAWEAAVADIPVAGVLPGDADQQQQVIAHVDTEELWRLPHIQEVFRNLAEHMAASERARNHTTGIDSADWLDYWHGRFTASVRYILEVRPTHSYVDKKTGKTSHPARDAHLLKLRDAEANVGTQPPASDRGAEVAAMWAMGAVTRIEELRRAAREEWLQEVNDAADQFVVLARNETRFRSEDQNAKPVAVYGLPEDLEGTVPASAFPTLLQANKNEAGFSPSVAKFMAALQPASGLRVQAENYGGHEEANPLVGNLKTTGKYSFDLHPGIPEDKNTAGFYDHDKVVKFFLAIEKAAQATGMAWTAYYNDFSVAKEVNEQIKARRIGFSGGGSPATAAPDDRGSLHHGPAPYILHIHVNIMPRELAAQFFAGFANPPPNLDLGDD